MNEFRDGHIVIIFMTQNTTFGWMTAKARIEYIPRATGDSWQFMVLEKDGMECEPEMLLVNPSCSDFAGLALVEEER